LPSFSNFSGATLTDIQVIEGAENFLLMKIRDHSDKQIDRRIKVTDLDEENKATLLGMWKAFTDFEIKSRPNDTVGPRDSYERLKAALSTTNVEDNWIIDVTEIRRRMADMPMKRLMALIEGQH